MTKDDDIYHPVSCADYSNYELAIIHKTRLRLAWRDADNNHNIGTVLPLDLQTARRAEFLVAEDCRGNTLRIRLDYIVIARPIDPRTDSSGN